MAARALLAVFGPHDLAGSGVGGIEQSWDAFAATALIVLIVVAVLRYRAGAFRGSGRRPRRTAVPYIDTAGFEPRHEHETHMSGGADIGAPLR